MEGLWGLTIKRWLRGSSSEVFPSVHMQRRAETAGLGYTFQKGLETRPGVWHAGSCSDLPSWALLPSSAQGL